MDEIKDLIHDFSGQKEVEAIALGGSRAAGTADVSSDYDIYIYLAEELPAQIRKTILEKYCTRIEIGNTYWEPEDDGILKSGTIVEIIYRRPDDFSADLRWTVNGCNASGGYTTCMWNNLLSCKILFDRTNRLTALQQEYKIPYPENLRTNIIQKNRELLDGRIPSYYAQIKKATERRDSISINHRVAGFLASYFDIIFAFNRQAHPGEKKLIEQCKKRCSRLPSQFEENLCSLLYPNEDADRIPALQSIIAELDALLRTENI